MASQRRIVLASGSKYRRELFGRLGLRFEWAASAAEEAELPGEAARDTALRLSVLKARATASQFADALIIGSDQVASCEGVRLGKPGNRENAVRQLEHMSGRTTIFDTAVSLLDARSGLLRSRVVPCRVTFRALTRARIEAYLEREQPYDCAGSAKAEGLGIALIARIETDDPTSLIGLPLIALTELLGEAGVAILG